MPFDLTPRAACFLTFAGLFLGGLVVAGCAVARALENGSLLS